MFSQVYLTAWLVLTEMSRCCSQKYMCFTGTVVFPNSLHSTVSASACVLSSCTCAVLCKLNSVFPARACLELKQTSVSVLVISSLIPHQSLLLFNDSPYCWVTCSGGITFCHSSLHGFTCDKMEIGKVCHAWELNFCVSTRVVICGFKHEPSLVLSSEIPSTCFTIGLLFTGAHQVGYVVQAMNPKEPFAFCIPSAGITNISHHTQLFMWVLGTEVRHFPSPRNCVIIGEIIG